MNDFSIKHPLIFSILAALGAVVLTVPFALTARALGASTDITALIAVTVETLYALGLVWKLGWWKSCGFSFTVNQSHVLVFPLLLAMIPILLFGTVKTTNDFIIIYSLILFLTGLAEETLNRGVILNALMPMGLVTAISLQSVLFSAGHVTQFFTDMPFNEVIVKLAATFAFGFLYGAIRILVGSIWPLVILHTLHNLIYVMAGTGGPFKTQSLPLSIHAIIAAFCLLAAAWIIRKIHTINSAQ